MGEISVEALGVPRRASPEEVLRAVLAGLEAGVPSVLATVVARRGSAPSTPGQKLALLPGGAGGVGAPEALGTVGGGAVERAVLAAMLELLARLSGGGAPAEGGEGAAEPRVETFRLGPQLGMCCGGSVDVLIEPMRAALPVLLVGAGHVGSATAPLLASVGFRVTLVDARPGAAGESRLETFPAFPSASSLGPVRLLEAAHDDAEVLEGFGDLAKSAFVVMSHDHALDQEAIAWALDQGFGFVGGVGSRAKAARTRARLGARGVSDATSARVRMPIGLDIGARTPAEIAVAITGELVAWRATLLGRR